MTNRRNQTFAQSGKCRLNLWARCVQCRFSITQMMSAQSTWSALSGQSASGAKPAESVSTPGTVEKTCSAVGLRNLLRLQMKSTRGMAEIASKV